MSSVSKLDLLYKEIEDEYVRENFFKLKRHLDSLLACVEQNSKRPAGGTSTTTIINQTGITDPTNTVKITTTIDPGQTLVVDTLATNSFISLDYLVAFEMLAENAVQSLKMFVGQDDGVYEEQVYALSGHDLCIDKNTQINNGVYELVFTNNEAHPVTVTFLRTLI